LGEVFGSTKERYAMKCKDTRNILSRYLDQELSSMQMSSVQEHLAQCSECQSEHEQQQRLWSLLANIEPVRAPNLIVAIEARLSEQYGWASILAGLRLRSIGYAAATAALVGTLVWTGFWAGTERHGSDPNEHVRIFTEFLSDAPPGMEVVQVLDEIGERP
jgi:predicted anti-sigma-YlaC factor YlaD